LKKVPEYKERPRFGQREMVLVIPMPEKKGFRNAVTAYILLRKSGVLARSITKVPLVCMV
jgi:hypothetical protein